MECAAALCSLPHQFALPHTTVRVLHMRTSSKGFTCLASSDDVAFAKLVEANPLIMNEHQGPIDVPLEGDVLLRVDVIREVNAFLAEIAPAQSKHEAVEGMDPQSVAIRLTQQQKENAIQQVRDLLKLAIELKW